LKRAGRGGPEAGAACSGGKRLFPLANGMELRFLPNKAAAGVLVGALVDKE